MAKRITLLDLIKAGLLEDGEKLECRLSRSGEAHVGKLKDNGSISHNSQSFDTPTGWAKHLNNDRPINGWNVVSAKGKKLSEYRSSLGQTESTKVHRKPPESDNDAEARSVVPTPDTLAAEREDNTASALLERIAELSPNGFEKLVGEFLRAKGFSNIKVTGGPNDKGIDGNCELSFIGLKVAFQAKRYQPQDSVGIRDVQRLQGSLIAGYDRGILVTTSSFSPGAKNFVEEEKAQIRLVDGEELVQQMIGLNLGVKTVPVVEHQIDESFFNRLTKE